MAETSGFFDAVLDEATGEYDLEYLSSQFAAYFAKFIGNGVFGSPTNQLKVSAGEGLSVSVSAGWAFIEGYWYYNDSDILLAVPPNSTSQTRTDSVKCRMDKGSREITILYSHEDVEVLRNDTVYELKLAEVIVPASSTSIVTENITDTRMNESVCGFVTQLLEVQTTEDLFAQYQALFDEWFANLKVVLSDDAAGALQVEIEGLKSDLLKVYANAGIRIGGLDTELKSEITISNPVIKPNSIINVYYAEDSKDLVAGAGVHYSQEDGTLHIMFDSPQPTQLITIDEIVVSNEEYVPEVEESGVGTPLKIVGLTSEMIVEPTLEPITE